MAQMLNMTELESIDDPDIFFKEIRIKSHKTIPFSFAVWVKSTEIDIYRMMTFKHWGGLEKTPKLMEYEGVQFDDPL